MNENVANADTQPTQFDSQATIRSDLWNSMNVSQLNNQLTLLNNRAFMLSNMMGVGAASSIKNLLIAVDMAIKDINQLISTKS